MDNGVIKISVHELRLNLTKYLTESSGKVVYITKINILVGELRVYNDSMRKKTKLKIANFKNKLTNNNLKKPGVG